jgi:hypothetical protein
MSVTLFNLFVSDPEPVLNWLAHNGADHVVRKQATRLNRGWHMKVALDDASLSAMFQSRWVDDLMTLDNQLRWLAEDVRIG